MITEETRDEFIMWFRSYLDRYFIVSSEYLYGEVAKHIPVADIQDYWNIYLKEKESLASDNKQTNIIPHLLRRKDDTPNHRN